MKKKGFSSRLLRKYRLTIHNENKLENVLGFYISPLWVILSLFLSFMLVAGMLDFHPENRPDYEEIFSLLDAVGKEDILINKQS